MTDRHDNPPTDEELALSREGKARIDAAMADVRAPQSLREGIERERAASAARPSLWHRYRWALAGAGAAAALAVAIPLALQSGQDAENPSLEAVYAAAEQSPAAAAPATVGGDPPNLDARVGALRFPDWRAKFGWRATGRSHSDVAGRDVTTVTYGNDEGAELGYAVVAGKPLAETPAGEQVRRGGNAYTVAREGERTIVTWTQQGHTCAIVAPAAVPRSTLVALAASRDA